MADQSRLICIEADPQPLAEQMCHQSACHFAPLVANDGRRRSSSTVSTVV
jgi:hypothetical protein